MIQTLPCPDATRWHALLVDTDVPDYAELESHLASCSRCRTLLDEIAVGSSGWLRDAGRLGGSTDNDPEMTKTLHRLRDYWPDDAHGPPIALDFLTPSNQPGLLGTLGRYQVLEVIGRGAMGIVLKAIDPDLLRPVAIKVLAPYLASSGTARQRFQREARAAAAVSHDHIVTIHAVEPAELPYLVMEFVSGISLQARLDRDGPLSPKEIARIGNQAACGLAAAHAVGLVHRDVKPANILLENGVERVKITDFGLARAADDARLTQSGVAAGTPLYMSPEQARGETVDQRSDLFSLGSVLYTLATGFPPFRAGSTMGVLNRIANDSPRPIRETIPDFPAALEAIIMQLLEKDPANRFQLAADVSVRLTGFLADPQPQPQPEYRPQPEFRPRRRRFPKWLETALPILAGVIVVGVVLIFQTKNATIFVEADDPDIQVTVDGEVMTISGTGVTTIRVKPGEYFVQANKDGKRAHIYQPQGSGGHVYVGPFGRQVVTVTVKPDASPPAVAGSNVSTFDALLEKRMKNALPDAKADRLDLMRQAWKVAKSKIEVIRVAGAPPTPTTHRLFPKLQDFMLEAEKTDITPGKLQTALQDAYRVANTILDDMPATDPRPVELAVGPAKADDAEAEFKKVIADYDALKLRLVSTPIGRVLALLKETDPVTDSNLSAVGVPEAAFTNARKLLSLRAKIVEQNVAAQAHLVDIQRRANGGLPSLADVRGLKFRTGAIRSLVDDLKKLADEIDPPPGPEGEHKKVMDEYDALLLRLAGTPVGRVLALVKETDSVSDSYLKESGVPEAGVPTARKLLALRNKIGEQAKEAQIASLGYNNANLSAATREGSANTIRFHTAAIRSLVGDLTKQADEIAPVPVAPDVEFKKVMAEYDSLVLRLVNTPVGRILALIPWHGSPRNSEVSEVNSAVGGDGEKAKRALALLDLRYRILSQSELADKALVEITGVPNRKRALGAEKADAAALARLDEDTAKATQEAKVRITALRGLIGDLKKLADEIDPPPGPEVEVKKLMAEYDALVLRLVKTPIGRLLTTTKPKEWQPGNLTRTDLEPADQVTAIKLLNLRDGIMLQAWEYEGALKGREQGLREKARLEAAKGDAKQIAEQETAVRKHEADLKLRTETLRGLVADIKKLAEIIDKSKG